MAKARKSRAATATPATTRGGAPKGARKSQRGGRSGTRKGKANTRRRKDGDDGPMESPTTGHAVFPIRPVNIPSRKQYQVAAVAGPEELPPVNVIARDPSEAIAKAADYLGIGSNTAAYNWQAAGPNSVVPQLNFENAHEFRGWGEPVDGTQGEKADEAVAGPEPSPVYIVPAPGRQLPAARRPGPAPSNRPSGPATPAAPADAAEAETDEAK